jgi:hypothetical protein
MTLPLGVTERRTRQGIIVQRIHYSADPDRGPEWATAERKKYSSQGAATPSLATFFQALTGDTKASLSANLSAYSARTCGVSSVPSDLIDPAEAK